MTERAPKHEGRLESDHDTEITKLDDVQTIKPEPYSAFSLGQRRFILGIVTAAGFFGPLSGGIYLPALPVLERAFSASSTVINATVSVFMVVFAVAVSTPYILHAYLVDSLPHPTKSTSNSRQYNLGANC